MPHEKNPDELGSLWSQTGAKGEYLTGTIDGVKVVCFRNDRATPENKQPAWRVLRSKPREGAQPQIRPAKDDPWA